MGVAGDALAHAALHEPLDEVCLAFSKGVSRLRIAYLSGQGAAAATTRSHRLVLTGGYSKVGAFAEVVQSTGERVGGRVVRRTAGEGLDRDS